MLHEMLAGAPPFTASNITSLIFKHVGEPPPPLPADLPLPAALRAAVLRALSKEPAARPRDASEFSREIQSALTSAPAEPTAASAAGTMPSAEPFFPATAHPVPVTPTNPPRPSQRAVSTTPASEQDEVTVVNDPSTAQPRPAPAPRPSASHLQQRPPAQPLPPPPAPPRPSRKGYVFGLLFVLLVGLGALAAVGGFLYMQRERGATANVNARPTPTPVRGNANATPTPDAHAPPRSGAGRRGEDYRRLSALAR